MDDGLAAREEEEGKDANREVKTRSVRPEAVKEDQSTREARRTSAQAQSATERESEGREFRHVPGGTWLNQMDQILLMIFFASFESGMKVVKRVSLNFSGLLYATYKALLGLLQALFLAEFMTYNG
ncbi:hypothetical protein NDU88_003349 [Pleurodeles waltl]|uniref:Uncharacterized protein n=1 Tax=Pleurodeles waltl TaxID=8319 RepID=A0AAV7RH53_PLEWA|nr:hypothetical protein NDU88_003349 [Pleurodeles waltl]